MEFLRLEPVGKHLCRTPVAALHKCVVQQMEPDPFFVHHRRQSVVPVEVELKPKRRPGWHTQIAQPQFRRYEVKVVVQAFGRGGFDIGTVGLLVVPRLIGAARLHRRKHVNQARMIAAILQDFPHPLFLAEVVFSDELDLQPGLGGKSFSVFPNLVTKRLRPFGIIENPDTVGVEKTGHALGVANTGNGPGDDNAVPAGKNPCDFIRMSSKKQIHGHYPLSRVRFYPTTCETTS